MQQIANIARAEKWEIDPDTGLTVRPDANGCLRFLPQESARRRAQIVRDGLSVTYRLSQINHKTRIEMFPCDVTSWVFLSPRQKCLQQMAQGEFLHMTVTLHGKHGDDRNLDKVGRAAMKRIVNFFQNHEWENRLKVHSVGEEHANGGHVAVLKWNDQFSEIEDDLVDLRTRYGRHSGPLTVSL